MKTRKHAPPPPPPPPRSVPFGPKKVVVRRVREGNELSIRCFQGFPAPQGESLETSKQQAPQAQDRLCLPHGAPITSTRSTKKQPRVDKSHNRQSPNPKKKHMVWRPSILLQPPAKEKSWGLLPPPPPSWSRPCSRSEMVSKSCVRPPVQGCKPEDSPKMTGKTAGFLCGRSIHFLGTPPPNKNTGEKPIWFPFKMQGPQFPSPCVHPAHTQQQQHLERPDLLIQNCSSGVMR